MFSSFAKIISCGTDSLCESFHAVQIRYVTQLLMHHGKSFHHLLLNQSHHRKIAILPFSIFMFIDPFPLVLIQNFVRFSKLPLRLVWKRICWFIPTFYFLSCVRIFYVFSFIIDSKQYVLNMKIFKFLNQFICVSVVTEFSKEQNKPSTDAVYHNYYCYRTFFSRLAVRLLSKIVAICRNYNHLQRRD